jgi:hypothetical protein
LKGRDIAPSSWEYDPKFGSWPNIVESDLEITDFSVVRLGICIGLKFPPLEGGGTKAAKT